MCIPQTTKRAVAATVIGVGLASCVNTGHVEINLIKPAPYTAYERAYDSEDATICRKDHAHTDICVIPQHRKDTREVSMFRTERMPSDFFNKSQIFACSSFSDRNRNNHADIEDIVNGPRHTFTSNEPITVVGYDTQRKRHSITVTDARGTILHVKDYTPYAGAHSFTIHPDALAPGDYCAQLARDECGQNQWNTINYFPFTVIGETYSIESKDPRVGEVQSIR